MILAAIIFMKKLKDALRMQAHNLIALPPYQKVHVIRQKILSSNLFSLTCC